MSTVKLSTEEQSVDLELNNDAFGQANLDMSPAKQLKLFCYDPGLTMTTACKSSITWLDGNQGRLLYRGYPINQLAEKLQFTEVIFLLMHGELPSKQEHLAFIEKLNQHSQLPDNCVKLIETLPKDAHPMGIISCLVSNMSAHYYNKHIDYTLPDQQSEAALRLIATMPSMVALAHRHSQGLDLNTLQTQRGLLTEQFTFNILAKEINDIPDPELVDALDKIFILHADHELNASTFTVRTAGSTGANPYACITAGLSALWGPAHGGANEACLNMLKEIGQIENIPTYLEKAKDKNDPFKLMGFGHRVYKNYDPRARIMRKICHQVLEIMGQHDNPLFKLALELEKIALEDPYFIEKKLYPNIDFYSGITLSAMGIPSELFTPIFGLARTTGWMAHWIEMYHTSPFKITRPRQWYIGNVERELPQ